MYYIYTHTHTHTHTHTNIYIFIYIYINIKQKQWTNKIIAWINNKNNQQQIRNGNKNANKVTSKLVDTKQR